MKKKIILIFVAGFILLSFGCKKMPPDSVDIAAIQTYRQIPGVTQQEIEAIEALKAQKDRLFFGHMATTEAFAAPQGLDGGFLARYCALLTELFGIEFTLQCYTWNGLLEALDGQALDFTGELTQTSERAARYAMTHSIAERGVAVYTRNDMPEILAPAGMEGLRAGILAGSITADYVRKVYPVDFAIVQIDDFQTAEAMLMSGEIDAFIADEVIDSFFCDHPQIRSTDLFPLVYVPVSMSTANPSLEPFISVMNKYIVAGGIDVLYGMYRQGETDYARFRLSQSYTAQERAYLENLKAGGGKVRIALEHENYPVSFYNEVEDEYQGFSIDILHEISQLTGIEFEVVPTRDVAWADILTKLKTGEISMITQLLHSDVRKDDYLWSSVPYAHSYYALISKSDYPNQMIFQVVRAKVGTITKTAFEDIYFESFPGNRNTVPFENMHDGLAALEKGKVDLLMASEYMLLTQLNYLEKPGYKVNARIGETMDSHFGFHKNEAVLRSIIDKAQAHIDTEMIVENWTNRVFDYSKNFFKEIMIYLIIFSAVLLFTLTIVLRLFLKNKRLTKELKQIAATDSMTGTMNRRHFEELATAQIERLRRLMRPSYIIILDLDFFKQVNDRYGHAAGDEVLKNVASSVKNTIRTYDLFARYGGEEFILMIPEVDAEAVREIARRLRIVIQNTRTVYNHAAIEITASFGVSCVSPHYNLEQAIRQADAALYRAKDSGRDCVMLCGDAEGEFSLIE